MKNDELAYLAGLMDGEGSVGLYVRTPKNSDRHSVVLRVSIGNTSKPMIDWLINTTKVGSVRAKSWDKLTRRQAWVWSVCSKQAVELLRSIRPWMITKAPQVDIVLKVAEMEVAENIRQGSKPSEELQSFRIEAAKQVKALKLVA